MRNISVISGAAYFSQTLKRVFLFGVIYLVICQNFCFAKPDKGISFNRSKTISAENGIISGTHDNYGRGMAYLQKYRSKKNVNQLILVEQSKNSISEGKLWLLTKDKNGMWHEELSCAAYLGKNGLGKQVEGDVKTPVGDYGVTTAFGIEEDPGSKIPYTKVTDTLYCCGDREYYNQIIDISKIDHKCTDASEHLISYKPQYNYALFIDYNKECEYKKGSGIFLHCVGYNKFTAGCVSIDERNMVKILQTVDSSARICIYPKEI